MSAFSHAERAFLSALREYLPEDALKKGILLGLSGGADSMLLLHLLTRLSAREGVPVAALHVEHGIRGEEALRDAAFARDEAARLSIPFMSVSVNVPAMAEKEGLGIEETARRVRYECLERAAREGGYGAIATAHHATDNAETVLLHLSRGSGLKGMCGIPALRMQNGVPLIRPLLSLSSEEIRSAVLEEGIPFVTDSTNADTAYRRNFVRAALLPRFKELNPAFDTAVSRMCESIREDSGLLEHLADEAYERTAVKGGLSKKALLSLHPALRCRVLARAYRRAAPDAPSLERAHTDAVLERLKKDGDFAVSLPTGLRAVLRADRILFEREGAAEHLEISPMPVAPGENILPDGSRLVIMAKASFEQNANVYKMAIHRDLSSATIDGGLYVRKREEGDAYRYGGVTHKLKKLLSDAKIPLTLRDCIPVVCDGKGILWVPGFGVREDGGKKEDRDMTLLYIPKKIQ